MTDRLVATYPPLGSVDADWTAEVWERRGRFTVLPVPGNGRARVPSPQNFDSEAAALRCASGMQRETGRG